MTKTFNFTFDHTHKIDKYMTFTKMLGSTYHGNTMMTSHLKIQKSPGINLAMHWHHNPPKK